MNEKILQFLQKFPGTFKKIKLKTDVTLYFKRPHKNTYVLGAK